MNKHRSGFTIVVVPAGNGKVQRFSLSRRRLHRFAAAAVLLAVGAASFAYSLYTVAGLPQRWHEQQQMIAQRLHLADIAARLDEAERTLARVQRLDRKLRVVLGQDGTPEPGAMLSGVGGPGDDDGKNFEGLDEESRIEIARLDAQTDEIGTRSLAQEKSLQDLQALTLDQANRLDSTPSIWPARGWVTSTFGMRISPFTGTRKMHEGIDIATQLGNEVYAPADGVVLFAGIETGYGKAVIIDHGYGVTTLFGHLSKLEAEPGRVVHRRSPIGLVGNTGHSTGPHLHYEVRVDGVPVDPYHYILADDLALP